MERDKNTPCLLRRILTLSYFAHFDTLSQNATDIITKCAIYFIAKCNKSLLQNASTFLLQNVTVYYKMRQFVQDETFITKCVGIHHLQDLMQGLRNCFNNRLLKFIKCFAKHQTSRYLPVQS